MINNKHKYSTIILILLILGVTITAIISAANNEQILVSYNNRTEAYQLTINGTLTLQPNNLTHTCSLTENLGSIYYNTTNFYSCKGSGWEAFGTYIETDPIWISEKSSYNTTTQLKTYFDTLYYPLSSNPAGYLTTYVDSTARVDNLNLTKLNVSDQRYNDTTYIDGKFGTLVDNDWCIGDGGKVVCDTPAPITLTYLTSNYRNTTEDDTQDLNLVNNVGNWSGNISLYTTTTNDLLQDLAYRYDRVASADRTEFYSVTAAYNTPWVLGAIASGTGPLIAGEPNHPGIVQFTSSTTASSGYTYNIAGATSYRLAGNETTQIVFRPYIMKLTNATATYNNNLTNIKFGFTDVITGADAVDGVYFNITQPVTSNTTLIVQLIGSVNSVRVTNQSATTLNNNTWYTAQVTINNTGLATGIIYSETGAEVLRLTTNSVPNAVGRETSESVLCWISGGTTAVKLCDVDYISVGYINPMRR